MGRKKRLTKGVDVDLWDQDQEEEHNTHQDTNHTQRSIYSSYDYRQHSGQPAVVTPIIRHVSHDPAMLRRVYLLQNFQVVLRRELFEAAGLGGGARPANVPQGLKKVVDCVRQSDSMVPWDVVHSMVCRFTPDDFQCPICLDPPVAARITECGHMFCLSCALHYLHLKKEENKTRDCPICHNSMRKGGLRPCILLPVHQPAVGEKLRFDLFYRERHSCIMRRYDDPLVTRYRSILDDIDKAEAEVKRREERAKNRENKEGEEGQEEEDEEEEEEVRVPPRPMMLSDELDFPKYGAPFASQCRYVISTEEFETQSRIMDATSVSEKLRELESLPQPLSAEDKIEEQFFLEALGEITNERGLSTSTLKPSPPMAPRPDPYFHRTKEKKYLDANSNHKNSTPISIFELYAEGEGQPYFLHMVTMKMLRYDAQLRNDGRLPDFVEAPIEEIVTLQQTEETKHVYKVFSSIPLHGVLKLCMLDLKEVVHPQTLRHFASELKKLRDERKQKRDKEERSYQMHSEDASWKQYVERYNCSSEATYTDSQMEGLPPMMLPSVGSQYSDHGLPPNTLDTRQRATKRGENLLETAPTEDTGVLSANVLQLVGGNTPRANANREVSPDSRATSNSCWTPGSAIKLFKK